MLLFCGACVQRSTFVVVVGLHQHSACLTRLLCHAMGLYADGTILCGLCTTCQFWTRKKRPAKFYLPCCGVKRQDRATDSLYYSPSLPTTPCQPTASPPVPHTYLPPPSALNNKYSCRAAHLRMPPVSLLIIYITYLHSIPIPRAPHTTCLCWDYLKCTSL